MFFVRALFLLPVAAGIFPGSGVFSLPTSLRAQDSIRTLTTPTRPGAARNSQVPKPPVAASVTAPVRTTAATTTSVTAAALPGGSVKIDGIEYIELVKFSKTLGLSATWTKAAEQLVLKKAGFKIEITGGSREFQINGTRVFAGSPIRAYKNSLWISRIDADNLLTPIAAPSTGISKPSALKIIAIDAGHGGIDKGKINERLKVFEKTFTLDTASRLKTLLEKQGYKVVMTRTTDKKIELGERPAIAAKAGADLFISIHFNSVESSPQSVSGVEVYRFTPRNQPPISRDKVVAEDSVANPADANEYWSTVAGFEVHRALLSDLKASDRGFKHHKFAVLRLATCPAILVEAGFLSNDTEAKKIATPSYRQKIAESIADGIKAYADEIADARK